MSRVPWVTIIITVVLLILTIVFWVLYVHENGKSGQIKNNAAKAYLIFALIFTISTVIALIFLIIGLVNMPSAHVTEAQREASKAYAARDKARTDEYGLPPSQFIPIGEGYGPSGWREGVRHGGYGPPGTSLGPPSSAILR